MWFSLLLLLPAALGPAVVVTEKGCVPAGKGEPGTAVRAPVVASIVNAETLLEPSPVIAVNEKLSCDKENAQDAHSKEIRGTVA